MSSWLHVTDTSVPIRLIPFGIAAAYLVVFVVQFPHSLWVLGWNPDYSSAYTVTETLAKTGISAHTVLGTTGGYVALWFGLLTATLPLHRALWELAPTGVFLATALAVAWSVAQVASRRAAALAALLILVAAPRAMYLFIAPIPHNAIVYLGTALLGAYLAWLIKANERRPALSWTIALLAGLALGTFIASDSLLIATGMVPFAITAILAGMQRGRRWQLMATRALTTVVVAIPTAKLTSTSMGALGFVTLAPSTAIAPLSALRLHAELMWEGLQGLFNGYLSGTPYSGLGMACEILMVAALATLLVIGVHTTAKFAWSGLRRSKEATTTQMARTSHIVYWAFSAGTTCVAFALSVRTEYIHEAYYATLIFSVAAIVVLLMRSRSASLLISVGASIFFVASLVGLTNNYMESYLLPRARTNQTPYVPAVAHFESQIVAFATANHASLGYAGYGDAPGLTWNSRERVIVRPVQICETQQGVGICPFFLELVPSAYTPAQRATFLLTDSAEVYLPSLPRGLGKPIATGIFGPLRMYIYSYDIAAAMGPPLD